MTDIHDMRPEDLASCIEECDLMLPRLADLGEEVAGVGIQYAREHTANAEIQIGQLRHELLRLLGAVKFAASQSSASVAPEAGGDRP